MWCGVVITFVRLELHSKWNTLPSIVFKVAPTQEALALPSLPLPPTPQPKEAPQTRTIPSAGPPLISLIIRAKNGNDSSQCGEYRISFLQRAQHHPSFDSRSPATPSPPFLRTLHHIPLLLLSDYGGIDDSQIFYRDKHRTLSESTPSL